MATDIYSADSSDLDGSTETVDRETQGRSAEHMWHVTHGLDVDVTATFYGTHEHDDGFSDAIQLGSVSIPSGGGSDFETLSDPWEQIRIEIGYGADPTTGTITIYENAER